MQVNKSTEVLLPLVARTGTPTANAMDNVSINNLTIIITVTAITATPSVVPVIEARDPASEDYYPLLTGAAITGTGTTVMKVGPDMPITANLSAQDMIPKDIRFRFAHADADSITYSVGLNYEQNRPI